MTGKKLDAAGPNPLLETWSGPFDGVPPFETVRIEHFAPAVEAAIAETLAAVAEIAADPAPPTFDNTLAPLERSGRLLRRVNSVVGVWRSTLSSPDLQAIEGAMMAELASLADAILQNEALFARIEAVHRSSASDLTAEQKRLAWHYYTDFVRGGTALRGEAKPRLAEINRRLAELSTRFDQNVLADENERYVLLESEQDLDGLPEPERQAASAAAAAKGFPGKWLIANTRSAVEPFLTNATRRDHRERVWTLFDTRGATPGASDNRALIAEILTLRAERASLLGYATHADWALEKTMAKTPARALELVEAVWPKAVARVREEVAAMRALAVSDGTGPDLAPWDYRYYAEKVRAAQCDLDWHVVEPFLQLERLREGMFWVAERLYGLAFNAIDVPLYHPDVRAWEVTDQESRLVGLFYFDPFARPGKRSGAWMSHYRRQERLDGQVTPIVSNNCNFLRPQPGAPALISWTDAVTLFHEFGHALHGLLSDVTYATFAGTSVSPDYVELPSQIHEFWLSCPEVLGRFALHYETGEPIPQALVERIARAARAEEGFNTTEQIASTLIDLRLHLSAAGSDIDPEQIERETLARYGMPKELGPRHRPPHFLHLFSGDQYAGRYYSYLWADILAADAYEAFGEGEGMFDRALAKRLQACVLSRGNADDPEEAYRAFRGRDPLTEPFMRTRGFLD